METVYENIRGRGESSGYNNHFNVLSYISPLKNQKPTKTFTCVCVCELKVIISIEFERGQRIDKSITYLDHTFYYPTIKIPREETEAFTINGVYLGMYIYMQSIEYIVNCNTLFCGLERCTLLG